METNPWQVECVEVFSHFICPECPFLTKEKGFFQDHAQEHHPLSCALFGTKGHTNIAGSDIDEKDEWSDSPAPSKGTKTITFSDINELSYLKKFPDDKLWDQYIVEENYDSFVESETEVHNESIENESASEAEGKTKEMIGLRNYKTDLSDQKHDEKKLYKEMSDLKNDQTIQTHDEKKLYEYDDDMSRYISFLHGGEKSFGCSICRESFSLRDQIKEHIISVHEGKPKKCAFCDEEFSLKVDLEKHFLSTHLSSKGSSKRHKCEICELKFSNISKKLIHMASDHDIKKSIKCIICGRKFSTNRNLNRHIKSIHAGKKRKSEKSTTLQKNICDVCGRSYVDKRDLTSHIASVHEGKKSFICEKCGAGFAAKKSLQKHIISVHDNDSRQSYQCPDCNTAITGSGRLARHIELKHGKNQKLENICDVCGRIYVDKRDLTAHIASVHEGKKTLCM